MSKELYSAGVNRFLSKVNERKNKEKYIDVYGGILLLRYISLTNKAVATALEEESGSVKEIKLLRKSVSSQGVQRAQDSVQKNTLKTLGIHIPKVSYEIAVSLYCKLLNISDSYNTQDGQIRWLQDNGFTEMNLAHFWSILPKDVKEKMNQWKRIALPFKTAIKIKSKLETITDNYNTEDGQIWWLEDNGFLGIHLLQFWSIIPENIRNRMTEWTVIDLPLNMVKILRKKLETIPNDYNTEDGQIRWLKDNGFSKINLAHFWSVIPKHIKHLMTTWKKMRLPLETTIQIRNQLENIPTDYNTEDGQIRWLQDNELSGMNLAYFWSIVPKHIRQKMTQWQRINLPFETAIKIREKIEGISQNYNTEDGQIRWLQDNGLSGINLTQFWSILPQKTRREMTQWKGIHLPFETAIKIREKIGSISPNYNTEDGQSRWLKDNGFSEINLTQFWSTIPKQIREKMTKWKYQKPPFESALIQHF